MILNQVILIAIITILVVLVTLVTIFLIGSRNHMNFLKSNESTTDVAEYLSDKYSCPMRDIRIILNAVRLSHDIKTDIEALPKVEAVLTIATARKISINKACLLSGVNLN